MRFLITHSLLSAWLYSLKENPFADATTEDTSKEDFMKVLRREPTPTNEAMQNGIDFENLVTEIVNGGDPSEEMEVTQEQNSGELIYSKKSHQWYGAACNVAERIKGGQLQFVARKPVTIAGYDLLLYGRLDALKAGKIFDIKFSKGYDRGKYVESTQHPMYLEIVPEAESFTYLVSNGQDVWTEHYRRDETHSIEPVIRDFMQWLNTTGNMATYQQYWGAKE